ncbi:MAG: hypothetical protein AAF449_15255, partial [Myxococcota bacterium]
MVQDIQSIAPLVTELRGLGYEVGDKLGCGMRGCTWALADGLVVKLTSDTKEACLAVYQARVQFEALPAIRFVIATKHSGRSLFAIIREDAKDLVVDDRRRFNLMLMRKDPPSQWRLSEHDAGLQSRARSSLEQLKASGLSCADLNQANLGRVEDRVVLRDLGSISRLDSDIFAEISKDSLP